MDFTENVRREKVKALTHSGPKDIDTVGFVV